MKKIAIITLHAVKNYGSVLQAWATQKIFENLGFEPQIIDYRRPWETDKNYYLYLYDHSLKGIMRQVFFFPTKVIQKRVFNRFVKNKLKLSKHSYSSKKDFEHNPIHADIYCTGSDQVWNSGWNKGVIEEYYLNFVPDNSKKIAYASSMGIEDITINEKNKIEKLLSSYSAISVREGSSVKLLNQLGFENVELVLDPTLQLKVQEWRDIVKDTCVYKKRYVLLVQLNRNKRFDKFAVDFSKEHDLELVRLCLRLDQVFLPGKHILIPDVEKYLSYISNANYILTDSFHAVSFCLNFNKQFYCVLPAKYSTRLKSILKTLELENRIVKDYEVKNGQDYTIDYEKVNKLIEEQRIKGSDFLREALGIEEEK